MWLRDPCPSFQGLGKGTILLQDVITETKCFVENQVLLHLPVLCWKMLHNLVEIFKRQGTYVVGQGLEWDGRFQNQPARLSISKMGQTSPLRWSLYTSQWVGDLYNLHIAINLYSMLNTLQLRAV